MRTIVSLAALAVCLWSAAAGAETRSKILHNYRDWEVRAVAWQDGHPGCLAQVLQPTSAFTIFAEPHSPLRVQFFSAAWQFKPGMLADFGIQVDGDRPFAVHGARLARNSMLFPLPAGAESAKFLRRITAGRRIALENKHGTRLLGFSLAGSGEALHALTACVKSLK